jgi:hypothetical protein
MIVPEVEPEVRPEDLAALGLTKEEEEEKEEIATVKLAPANAANMVNIQLPSGMNVAQQMPFEEGADDIPFTNEAPMALQQPQQQFQSQPQQQFQSQPQQFQQPQQQGGGGVNVQTSSQPVLVIPMNVGTPAPTEIVQSPMRGAPGTIAVDTSDRALNAMGLPSQQERSNRGTSPNARRPSSGGSRGGAPVVNVQRQGSSAPSNSNANVRVQVTKQG